MKLIIDRYTIVIEPENDQDIAYVEDTLGLLRNGDFIRLERLDSQRGFILETDEASADDPVRSEEKSTQIKKYPDPELAAKFKDIGVGNDLEKTTSRNGGETLVDIKAIDI